MAKDIMYINDFSGGLNIADGKFQLLDNECLEADNIVFTRRGAFDTRQGYAQLSSNTIGTASAIKSLYRYYYAGTRALQVAGVVESGLSSLYWYEQLTGAGQYIPSLTSFSSGAKIRFADFKSFLFAYDGVNTWKWWAYGESFAYDIVFQTGSGYKTLKSDVRCMAICDERIFVVFESEPYTLWYSDFGGWNATPGHPGKNAGAAEGLIFPEDNYLNIPEQSRDLGGIKALYRNADTDDLTICLENYSLEMLGVGQGDYQLRLIAGSGGCISKDGIAKGDNQEFFVVGNDVLNYVKNGNWYQVSENISELVDSTYLQNCEALYDTKQSLLYINGIDGLIVGNVLRGREGVSVVFSKSNIEIQTYTKNTATSDNNDVIFTKPNDTKLYQLGAGYTDDNGTAISWKWRSKYYDWDQFAITKFLRHFYALAESASDTPFTVTLHLVVADGRETTRGPITLTVPTSGNLWNASLWNGTVWSSGDVAYGSADCGNDMRCLAVSVELNGTVPVTVNRIGIEHELMPPIKDMTFGRS